MTRLRILREKSRRPAARLACKDCALHTASGGFLNRSVVSLHATRPVLAVAKRWLVARVFRLQDQQASFRQRRFYSSSSEITQRLEHVGRTFIFGYNSSLASDDIETLSVALDRVPHADRGFAYEGAAMGLAIQDALGFRVGSRLSDFIEGPAKAFTYLAHIGAGWAMALLPLLADRISRTLDPILRSLAFDGIGFYRGYFEWPRYVSRMAAPRGLNASQRQAFDQGLGRSLWFVYGGSVSRIASAVARFEQARVPELWSGVGLACAYAGGVPAGEIEALRSAAGAYGLELAQGVGFAAKARIRAGNPTHDTETACRALCGCPAAHASVLADRALEQSLCEPSPSDPYQAWRVNLRSLLAEVNP